jgi:hypothetical protein
MQAVVVPDSTVMQAVVSHHKTISCSSELVALAAVVMG